MNNITCPRKELMTETTDRTSKTGSPKTTRRPSQMNESNTDCLTDFQNDRGVGSIAALETE